MRSIQAPLSALILLSPATLDGVPLLFEPEPDSTRRSEIECVLHLDGGELSCVMDDAEVPREYLPDLHMRMEDRHRQVLTETCAQRGADELVLLRRYDELVWDNEGSMQVTMQGQDQEWPWTASGESPLEGRTVRLVLDRGTKSATATLADDGPRVDLPARLSKELGWQGFVSEELRNEGAQWKVDGAALGELFEPGGDLAWELPPELAEHMLKPWDERSFEGELTLVLEDVADDHARASVRGKLVRITVQPGDLSHVPVVEGTATDTVEDTWQVAGELVWDLAANQLASLTLAGDWSTATTTEKDPGQPGSTYSSVFTVEGSYSFEVRSAAVEERVAEAASPR